MSYSLNSFQGSITGGIERDTRDLIMAHIGMYRGRQGCLGIELREGSVRHLGKASIQ